MRRGRQPERRAWGLAAVALLISACAAEPARTGRDAQDTHGPMATVTPPLPLLLDSVPVVPAPALTRAQRHGQVVYEGQCATCHGLYGHGDGPGARSVPAPLPDIGRLAAQRPAGELVTRMAAPKPGASSPESGASAWHALPAESLRAAVAYLQAMNPPGSRGNPAAGRLLYAAYCVQCHGVRGAGDGRLAAAFASPPADLRALRFAAREAQVLASIREGGSRDHRAYMPDWGRVLTDQQLQDLVAYLEVLRASR